MNGVQIVGALNVTPDSFYDGGKFLSVDAAVERAGQMLADGADIVEIGGQSSLNAELVSGDEERRRVIPVLAALRKTHPSATFSIDTMTSAVAEEGIKNGAAMINDVSAGRRDPRLFSVAADGGAQLVLMYSKDIPPTDKSDHSYDDVVGHIKIFLSERVEAAIKAGVAREKIIIDPGLGFFVSSDPKYSFEIIRRLGEFTSLGFPVFLSPSRKSFLAGSEKLPPADRLPGTIAASAMAVMNGATYIRTHDVKEVKRGCEVVESAQVKSE
ncbi:MAG: dihydropteroate synthase [Candidatus Peribacteraceae bacterium]|nr:dihydropteroate synthase [Candidatus Peribacteraceae bacterium]